MAFESPFSPTGDTVSISATTSSANANVTNFPSYNNSGALLITNGGTQLAFVKWGNGTQTATSAAVPIPGGTSRVFSVANVTNVAAITPTSTTTIYATPGNGSN